MAAVYETLSVVTLWSVTAVTGLVAVIVFVANPRRNWNQWLAFFLGLVSANFAFQGIEAVEGSRYALGEIGSGEYAERSLLLGSLSFVFLILDPPVLAYFAAVFPRRTGVATGARGLLLLAPVVPFMAYEVATRRMSYPTSGFDPMRTLFFAYLGGCYLFALWRIVSSYLGETSSVMARQVRIVAVGMFVAIASRIALLPSDLYPILHIYGPRAADLADLALRIFILWAVFFALATVMHRRARDAVQRAQIRSMVVLVGLAFAGFTALWSIGRLAAAAYSNADPPLHSSALLDFLVYVDLGLVYGVRWFAFCAAILYGIVRYQVLSVGGPTLGAGTLAVAAMAGFFGIGLSASRVEAWVLATLTLAVLALGSLGVYLLTRSQRSPTSAGRYLEKRRIDVYRALLAASLAKGTPLEAQRQDLERSRRRLGISPRVHEMLLTIAEAEESSSPDAEVFQGRYVVLRRIGFGGYATVFLARDAANGKLVALKRISKDLVGAGAALQAARRELEVARRVSHPRLIAIHAVIETDEEISVIMDFAEGGSLRDWLRREQRLAPQEAANVLRDALAGLVALHDAGIVHGDLKPENLLVSPDGRIRLSDFGAARALPTRRTLVRGSPSDAALGSLLYMSPEQVTGQRVTPRSDLFSLGAVAHEVLTGRPFVDAEGASPADLVRALARPGTVRNLAEAPPEWARFLQRALARDPRERFESAKEMAAALPIPPTPP